MASNSGNIRDSIYKDIISAPKGAPSDSLKTVIEGLKKSTAHYDASEIKASIELGKGMLRYVLPFLWRSPRIDEESLIEILCSRSNAEIEKIKKVYKKSFDNNLKEDVKANTSGYLAKLLLNLVEPDAVQPDPDSAFSSPQVKRDKSSSFDDGRKIDQDARALFHALSTQKGTNVNSLFTFMTQRSVPYLQKVFEKRYFQNGIEECINQHVKTELKKPYLTLVQCIKNKPLYFATRLHEAMKNKEEKEQEKVLTRIIVSRCEVDLKEIKEEYEKHYGKPLCKSIKKMEFTEEDYQWALLKICNGLG